MNGLKMSKVGNQTNSQDPQAVNSRVFVGNLNTFQCSKNDVERIFQRYGCLAGISMHKGYAFVQFTNPFDARSACLGEDNRVVFGQVLDVNMVAEPKSHQTGRKRQNLTQTGNDWDYYYDSYYASTFGFALSAPGRVLLSMKRSRMLTNSNRTPSKNGQSQKYNTKETSNTDQLKVYSNQDILICGNCREMFSELKELIEHKKNYCKLRFTCKCDNKDSSIQKTVQSGSLFCVQCKDSFANAWDLMVHAQAAHMINIYELGIANKCDTDSLSVTEPQTENNECHNTNGSASFDQGTEMNTVKFSPNTNSKTEFQIENKDPTVTQKQGCQMLDMDIDDSKVDSLTSVAENPTNH